MKRGLKPQHLNRNIEIASAIKKNGINGLIYKKKCTHISLFNKYTKQIPENLFQKKLRNYTR